ncbi:hypothetical protein IV203_034061 [Nitzschia inconspicua]|uniref:Uncharacterized protein n=1 Tax=Nitzschia inconspicua TaxID=303405 RepID=A0A9K3M3N1_9STRA|nr:hypothetical protein IV203_034061 [Nitzschia inconspicua]
MPPFRKTLSIGVCALAILSFSTKAFVVSPSVKSHANVNFPLASRTSNVPSLPPKNPFSTIDNKNAIMHSSPLNMLITSSLEEKIMEKIPSKKVIDAVVEAKSDKIVASDVATRAGVSLSQARKDLTTLASLSRGDVSVSADGELIYEFPSNLQSVLSSNSAKYKALQTFEKAWPRIFWGIRVSFGVALVASVALIFSTILVLQTSSNSDDDRRRDDRRGGMSFGGGFGGIWGPSPFDFFYYRPYGYYGYYGQRADRRDPDEMGFLESVFSYVFGDGNPNNGLEERRLSLAAQMIRDNQGAVTAEQLAPYCDAPNPDDSSGTYVDESFVLPIVSQLDGEPRVTDDGDIIYVFPDLQLSASTEKVLPQASEETMVLKRAGLSPKATPREIRNLLRINGISTQGAVDKKDLLDILKDVLPPMSPWEEEELIEADPTLLQEKLYKFSLAPAINKFFAGALGVVNLGGALYLGNLLNQYALYGIRLPSFLGVAQSLYPLLLAYAVLFNVIPIARNFWISVQNSKIEQRNNARRKWREKALQPSKDVIRKLKAATKFALNRKLLKGEDIVYDTKQSANDIQQIKSKMDLEEFDKLLNNDKNAFQ